jgi:hypothetical protein
MEIYEDVSTIPYDSNNTPDRISLLVISLLVSSSLTFTICLLKCINKPNTIRPVLPIYFPNTNLKVHINTIDTPKPRINIP